MRRQIKQGISAVLSAAMILSSGGSVRGVYAAERVVSVKTGVETEGNGQEETTEASKEVETSAVETKENETEAETSAVETTEEVTEAETSAVETTEEVTEAETSTAGTTEETTKAETSVENITKEEESTEKETSESEKIEEETTKENAVIETETEKESGKKELTKIELFKKAAASMIVRAGMTADDLINKLNSADAFTTHTISDDIEFSTATTLNLKFNQVVIIPTGNILTISAKLTNTAKLLTFGGEGDIKFNAPECFKGRLAIGYNSSNTVATIEDNCSITEINDITVNANATLKVNSSQGLRIAQGKKFEIKSNATVSSDKNSSDKASIYLDEGATVTAPDGIFKDQDNEFSSSSAVTVGAADAAPTTTGLSAGDYVWDGTCFAKTVKSLTAQDLKDQLEDTKATTAISINDDLTFNLDTAPTTAKTINIAKGKNLTITGTINAKKEVTFTGEGTVIVDNTKGLEGKVKFQNGVICQIGSSGSIYMSSGGLYMDPGTTLKMSDGSKIEGNDKGQMINIASGVSLDIVDGAGIDLKAGYKFPKAGTGVSGKFNDQGKIFIMDGSAEVTVSNEDAEPAENQLTAGLYTWDGTHFFKPLIPSTTASVTTPDELKVALESEVITTINVTGNIDLNEAVSMPQKKPKTLNINSGTQLTISNKITTNGSELKFGGNGTVSVNDTLEGSISIGTGKQDNITFKMNANSMIRSGGKVTLGPGAEFYMSATSQIIGSRGGQTYTIDPRSSLHIESGAKFNILETDKITAPNRFSDQGKAFTIETQVIAGAATAAAEDNKLSAGDYVWNGTCFAKEKQELSDWLKAELENPKFSTINVTNDIMFGEEVTMGDNHVLNIAEGKTLTISGKILTGKTRLTLTGKGTIRLLGDTDCLNGNIDIGYPDVTPEEHIHIIVDGNSGIKPDGVVKIKNGAWLEINSPEGIRVNEKKQLIVETGGKLTGGANGAIILAKGGRVTDANGNNKFSDQGKIFTVTGEVTAGAAADPAADNQLTAGTYTWNGNCFAKPVPPPLPDTKLENGILTLSKDSVNAGSTQGWAWDAEKNTLNVNYRFKDIKQIRFAKNEPAVIRINGDTVITPDAGMDAIIANDGLTIRADEAYTLSVKGRMDVKGGLTVINKTVLDLSGSTTETLLNVEGNIMFKDNTVVKVNNPGGGSAIRTGGSFTTKDAADVALTAKGSNASLQTSGKISVGGPTAILTVINEGAGVTMNKAPDTASYEKVRVTASVSPGGRPGVEYQEGDLQTYKYLKIRKMTEFSDTPTAAEVENAVESIKPDDYQAINDVIEQLYRLDSTERAKVKPETITKLDRMLQEATGIKPRLALSVSAKYATLNSGQQIKNAQIDGVLIALGNITTDNDASNTEIVFHVDQIEKVGNAYATFVCSLTVNGKKTDLKLPVTVKVTLPPEYFPLGADQIYLVESGRWIDFTYYGKDNTATFRTGTLGTISLVRKNGPKKTGGGGYSGGGGGGYSGGGGGGGSSSGGSTTTGLRPQTGTWIQDSVGWWYQYTDKTYPANGWFQLGYSGKWDWYYFNKDGYMVTGWLTSDGKKYYLNPISNGTQGKMMTGWQIIDGKWYYFNEKSDGTKGALVTDTWIGDIYVGSDGIWDKTKKK